MTKEESNLQRADDWLTEALSPYDEKDIQAEMEQGREEEEQEEESDE
jgi:hypothetical protein